MIWPFKRRKKEKVRPTRLRIFLSAFILCAIAGAIYLPEPLEDLYRGGRNMLRARPADKSIVIVAIDDRTVSELGSLNHSRSYDAALVDRLFALGAKQVYFDKAFADRGDPAGDAAFADTLTRHSGKVFLGAMFIKNRATEQKEVILPTPQFRSLTPVRSLSGSSTAFSLSAELYYAESDGNKVVPGIASAIAGITGSSGEKFRPDWSIQIKTVPTISFMDVISGKAKTNDFSGKTAIVAVSTEQAPDFLHVAGQEWFPGVYVHAVGAQTLREGHPVQIGWLPAFLLAAALSGLLLKSKSRLRQTAIILAGLMIALAAPFVLDAYFITASFLPGFLMFGIVAYRNHTLRELSEAERRNVGTHLPNLSALREEHLAASKPIIAMRIRNYAAVGASFADSVEDELVNEVARRLTLPGESTTFYQGEDVLYWLGPILPMSEMEGHLAGLARLIESQFVIQGRKIDIHVAFGIDMNVSRPVANRIGRALMAADNAAATQQLMQFNTSENDEERVWELSLMSELDAAIDAGDIWIAYQPQFDLRNERINGAEALVRWQHPTRGAISPEAFILPAEAHNRITRLTFHILEQATRAAKFIVDSHPEFRLSVNVSANLLGQPHLPERVIEVLGRTGFPAANLTLEVTESAPFKERGAVAANLAGIAALGIDLSIDDYGTGNATLEYMRSVPCQEIKIDRSFVSGLVSNASDLLLVESTIELAHGLGRRVIAEGIEDPETLELLRAIGCDTAQGYYLAKPMRLEALEALLLSSARIRAA
jgi:diguanylate cyclase